MIYRVTLYLLIFALVATQPSCTRYESGEFSIIPEPQFTRNLSGLSYKMDKNTVVYADGEDALRSASFFTDHLLKYYNLELQTESTPARIGKSGSRLKAVEMRIAPIDPMETGYGDFRERDGLYRILIEDGVATLTGNDAPGLFYATQSLIQLLEGNRSYTDIESSDTGRYDDILIPSLEIVDFPRFEYRGMHLDVVRHIYPVEYVKKYIDYIALHKMNYFHWHLTDDQGWRMESKKYPQLNELGSWRDATIIGLFPGTGIDSTRYGGFYTVDEMKEIVNYAEERYITIVPEIDMPAHCMAVISAFPQFSTTPDIPKRPATTWGIFNRQNNVLAPSEEVFVFLEDVFNEMMDIFPGRYIHIGADECAKKWWRESPSTQRFIKEHNLKDEDGLQRYFVERVGKIVRDRGREFVGWDEMVDDGPVEGGVVMNWRHNANGRIAAEQGHKVIMTQSRYSYFNIAQRENEDTLCHRGYVPLDSVYLFEPIPADLSIEAARNIIGGQGCIWTEYFPHKERLEYAIFPRMSAISEVYWTLPEKRDLNRFKAKLKDQFARYDRWGANYYRSAQADSVVTGL